MFLGELIKKYRAENSMSMQAFADASGLSKAYIQQLENNLNPKTGEAIIPSADTFSKVAAAMHISLSDIIRQVDENQPIALASLIVAEEARKIIDPATISNLHTPGAYRVPILGEICAGDGVFTEEDFKGWFFLDGTIKCDYVLEVKGDSMEDAGIFDGDRVMILRTYDYFGKICAVVIRDTNEAVLKPVDATSDKLVLTSYNKKYEPMIYEEQDVLIVGECVGVYHAWEDEEKK